MSSDKNYSAFLPDHFQCISVYCYLNNYLIPSNINMTGDSFLDTGKLVHIVN